MPSGCPQQRLSPGTDIIPIRVDQFQGLTHEPVWNTGHLDPTQCHSESHCTSEFPWSWPDQDFLFPLPSPTAFHRSPQYVHKSPSCGVLLRKPILQLVDMGRGWAGAHQISLVSPGSICDHSWHSLAAHQVLSGHQLLSAWYPPQPASLWAISLDLYPGMLPHQATSRASSILQNVAYGGQMAAP